MSYRGGRRGEELTPETPETLESEPEEEPIKQRKNGLYPGVSDELAENMTTGWADTELHDLEPIAQAAHTAARRAALSARFPGERLVIPAGNLKTRSNDTEYAFRASTEYAYLTGDQTEDGVLVLEPTGRRAQGHHLSAAALQPRERRVLAVRPGRAVGRPPPLPHRGRAAAGHPRQGRARAGRRSCARRPARSASYAGYDAGIEAALTDKVTAERDEELRVFLSEARLVKDEFEIGELQKAVDSTVRGFEDVVKVLDKAEATSERYIEGTFFLRARVEGNDVGYGSICAAGPHATTLHWVRNDGPVRSGELLLLDAGVETHTLYTADVTRTLPINGTLHRDPAQDLRRGVRGPGGRHRGGEAGRQVPRLPRRRAARAGREARRVGSGRGPGGAGPGAGPAAPLDAARHRPHARHGRPRLRRRAHRGVRRRHAGAGHGA